MPDVCVGGLYDGMPIKGIEDRASCQENEGAVQSRGGGGCTAANIAPMAFVPSHMEQNNSAISALLLLPLRLVRDSLAHSPMVMGLDALNDSLFPEVVRIAEENDEIKAALVNTLVGVSYFAASMLESTGSGSNKGKSVFTKSIYNRIAKLAEEIKPRLCDETHIYALNMVVTGLSALVGKNATQVYAILHRELESSPPTEKALVIKFRDAPQSIETSHRFTSRFPGGLDSTVSVVNDIKFSNVRTQIFDAVYNGPSVSAIVIELFAAEHKIESKAAMLGSLAGSPIADTESIGNGKYVRRYQGADIYFSANTAAHEVHGDIRAKYNALGGPNSVLGMPLTDEQGTPDGIGRYNHFENGSIYWTLNTGPMMIHTALRNLWASQGWERGFLGYPVADQHRKVFFNPAAQPAQYWEFFQNGAIFASKFEAAPALIAELSLPKLATLIRQFFDAAFHDANSDLGIEGGINLLRVSDWSFGFWASVPRNATFEIQGFHKRQGAQLLVGCCGLRTADSEASKAELGVELGPEFWGRYGYAIEIRHALVDFGFGNLKLSEIYGGTVSANARVARLASSFGAVATTPPTPAWMAARGWSQIEWHVTREKWESGRLVG